MTNNPLKTNTLKRHEILKSSVRIASILRSGRKLHGRCLSLYFVPAEGTAFAVLVNRNVGNSVQRNKIKRWVREIYRREKNNILHPCALIFMINKHFSILDFSILKSDIEHIIAKLNSQKP